MIIRCKISAFPEIYCTSINQKSGGQYKSIQKLVSTNQLKIGSTISERAPHGKDPAREERALLPRAPHRRDPAREERGLLPGAPHRKDPAREERVPLPRAPAKTPHERRGGYCQGNEFQSLTALIKKKNGTDLLF